MRMCSSDLRVGQRRPPERLPGSTRAGRWRTLRVVSIPGHGRPARRSRGTRPEGDSAQPPVRLLPSPAPRASSSCRCLATRRRGRSPRRGRRPRRGAAASAGTLWAVQAPVQHRHPVAIDLKLRCPDCGVLIRAPTQAAVLACPGCDRYLANPGNAPGAGRPTTPGTTHGQGGSGSDPVRQDQPHH
jgi:hypothetical protein